MRISDWSSDLCSSDLGIAGDDAAQALRLDQPGAAWIVRQFGEPGEEGEPAAAVAAGDAATDHRRPRIVKRVDEPDRPAQDAGDAEVPVTLAEGLQQRQRLCASHDHMPLDGLAVLCCDGFARSEEHTSELQSLMRISYAVFCLNKKN